MRTAKIIKKLRKTNHLTRDQLAKKINVPNLTITKWESGRRYPNPTNIKELCVIFNVAEDYFKLEPNINRNKDRNKIYIRKNKSIILMILIATLCALIIIAYKPISTVVLEYNEVVSSKKDSSDTLKKENEILSRIANSKVGDIVKFGKYEQDNNIANGKEDIGWRLLAVYNSSALLLSEKILDNKTYHKDNESITWENCTLRRWLNIDFYNAAFNTLEQSLIKTSTLENENNPREGTDGGNFTDDKIFLLTLSDSTNTSYGFSSSTMDYDEARSAQGTDFAKNNGLSANDSQNKSAWWLRTPGNNQNSICIVWPSGYIYYWAS